MFMITRRYTPRRETFSRKVDKSELETVVQGKGRNTGLSTEVQRLGLSTLLKTVSFQSCNDQCHVKYVKINRLLTSI